VSQFSLFGAAVAEPTLADLDGVLLAGGHWARGPERARLSVVVADRWRAEELAREFARRGVGGDDAVVDAEVGASVRTDFTPALVARADRWLRGATETPPLGFELTPGGLRLWAVAAGRRDERGYLFATASAGDAVHRAAGAQLSRLGVAAVSIAVRGGPGWRVTSAKRIRRLAELLGPPPEDGAPVWPLPG
jgi:hypothetical protein